MTGTESYFHQLTGARFSPAVLDAVSRRYEVPAPVEQWPEPKLYVPREAVR
jgi:hypothetical protein